MLLQSWRNTLIFFGITSILVVVFKNLLAKIGIDYNVVIGANIYLCIVNLLSLVLLEKGLRSGKNNSFMMAFYGNAFLKIFLTLIIVFIYVYTAKKVNKIGVVSSFLLYFIYTFLEVMELKKITQELKNAKDKSGL